ncbi:PREDICTED: nitrilase and fragile histidine triad fusion protein NitFhit isoform X5 [Acromyrmex echinatior]|uniref:nitrilase and fragile histidine triad fusion protein NitFhit isoform X5 n=1 Tax=Acromyrmex echinatior TaxID=103372 RepID=UPI000580FB74|nr:PREDICTED: nitrilase and fragile histidine triad fusion protein NitFhit isoform X5 [Acromyrmex echinatior]
MFVRNCESSFGNCRSSINIQPAKRYINTMIHPLIAVCQMRSIADKVKNLQVVSELAAEAKRRSATIAFFPEACDFLADNKKDIVTMAEPLTGLTVTAYKEIAIKNNIWLSLGGIHEASDNVEKIYNTHVLINNEGELVAMYKKLHLFDMDNKDTGVRLMESDYVLKGIEIVPPVPTPIGKLALSICYDMRFPELSIILRNMGAQILTYPSAFTYETGAAHWEVMLRARAIENQCYVIAAAQTGAHNQKRKSWGHAMVMQSSLWTDFTNID